MGQNPRRAYLAAHRRQWYACQFGHRFAAYDAAGEPADLEGHFCPMCLGQVIGHGDMLDPRLLAPVQIPQRRVEIPKQP